MKIYPIFIPFAGCENRCIYCQQNLITRTDKQDFSKIRRELTQFCTKYHDSPKEIAFYGGSFTLLSTDEQRSYLEQVDPFIPLIEGIRVSTRPDGITRESLIFAKGNNIRTIELGIQSFHERVLNNTGRPYTSQQGYIACQMIRSSGFQLGIQLMPGLPGETKESISRTIQMTISLNPDFVRIYPTLVLKGTHLEKMYKEGNYKPLSLRESIDISANMTQNFRAMGIKVIKTGLHSDLSYQDKNNNGAASPSLEDSTFTVNELPESVIAGPYHPAYGELVSREILFRNMVESYGPGKTFLLSSRSVSLLRRDDAFLLKRLKKTLQINQLPIIFSDMTDKEKARTTKQRAEVLW